MSALTIFANERHISELITDERSALIAMGAVFGLPMIGFGATAFIWWLFDRRKVAKCLSVTAPGLRSATQRSAGTGDP